jgi:hypothetical protein
MSDDRQKSNDEEAHRKKKKEQRNRLYRSRPPTIPIDAEVVQDRHRRELFLNVVRFMMNKSR